MRPQGTISTLLHTLCVVSSVLGSSLRPLGQTVHLGDVTYYLPGVPVITAPVSDVFRLDPTSVHLIPITHLPLESEDITVDSVLVGYDIQDDVWTREFSEYIFLSGQGQPKWSNNSAPGASLYHINDSPLSALATLPPGPYFAQISPGSVSIFKAYRIYDDLAGAFAYGVFQEADESFSVLSATSPLTRGGATIAVPSRLYYAPASAEKPFSGVRVGVKDLYDLKGLKTGAGSRAWFQLYSPAESTAESIQYLIDLGAVVVGKTITSQFANGEAPTADWVDGHASFNARGEGYQDASSSSTGAGSAQSNYDWIDMNIGSDTGGSVRAPAAVTGVFGNRPSQHLMSLSGVVPMSAYMDTPAFMSRSASKFASWGRAWYSAGNSLLQDYQEFPSKLIYPMDSPGIDLTKYPSPGFFPSPNHDAQEMYDHFTEGLEQILGANRTQLDFYKAYKETSGTNMYPVEQLGSIWNLMVAYEQFHGPFSKVSADYSSSHGGDKPYFDPPLAASLAYGRNITTAKFQEAVANKTIFKNWLESELLIPQLDTPSCSSALLIHPIWSGAPVYRDVYPGKTPQDAGPWFGWNKYGISQLGGVPEVVIPLGQVSYISRITGTKKWLPVAVSINAAAGCDLMLYRLVERLAENRIIPKVVTTGQSLGV